MKVLVTGATGFIGRNLLAVFDSRGIEYVSVGRGSALGDRKKIQLDLLENCALMAAIREVKPTHLIHLAWYTAHGKYWESPLNVNWLSSTSHLVEAFCESGGQHVLVAGTCAEYDWRYGYCVEDLTPLNPKTLYGISKNATRSMVERICEKYDVGLAWTRIFFPYGAGEPQERLIPSLFQALRCKKPSFGVNAAAYRDLLHVTDVAEAVAACSEKNATGHINISSAEPFALEAVVREIASICKSSPDEILSLESRRTGEPRLLVGDNEKLKSLGWRQKVSFTQGIKNY